MAAESSGENGAGEEQKTHFFGSQTQALLLKAAAHSCQPGMADRSQAPSLAFSDGSFVPRDNPTRQRRSLSASSEKWMTKRINVKGFY